MSVTPGRDGMTKDAGIPEVICIAGPTASGKTALAVEAALMLGGEVISADSMQIYRFMDIGTAKPTDEEKRGVPHHMLDFLDPSEEYSVAQYVEDAKKIIARVHAEGKVPVVAGGTGQYISALVDNLSFDQTEADPALQAELTEYAGKNGAHALHLMLRAEDPAAAEGIHENNVKRVIRALEMKRLTGLTLAERNAASRSKPVFAAYRVFGIKTDRPVLYDRIDRRVDVMMESGLEREAEALFSRNPGRTASQAIGYKEFLPYFNGEAGLDAVICEIKKNTRNYAKRQLTWFRRPGWVEWEDADGILSAITAAAKLSRG